MSMIGVWYKDFGQYPLVWHDMLRGGKFRLIIWLDGQWAVWAVDTDSVPALGGWQISNWEWVTNAVARD